MKSTVAYILSSTLTYDHVVGGWNPCQASTTSFSGFRRCKGAVVTRGGGGGIKVVGNTSRWWFKHSFFIHPNGLKPPSRTCLFFMHVFWTSKWLDLRKNICKAQQNNKQNPLIIGTFVSHWIGGFLDQGIPPQNLHYIIFGIGEILDQLDIIYIYIFFFYGNIRNSEDMRW